MATTNVTMRIDTNVKAQLQELMSDLGLDMTTFFTMAAKQAIREFLLMQQEIILMQKLQMRLEKSRK